MRLSRTLLAIALATFPWTAEAAWSQQGGTPTRTIERPIRAFIHCNDVRCDEDFIQEEIRFVEHVRDRADADVHVLITAQRTAAGGRLYTLSFIGLGEFRGEDQALAFTEAPGAADDLVRQEMTQRIKLGLVPYVARTALGERLRVGFDAPEGGVASASVAERDPWDRWSFRIRGNGFFNGEQSFSSRNLFGSLNANRTTEAWKIQLSLNAQQRRQSFEVDSSVTYVSTQSSRGLSALAVRSLGPHLSAGLQSSLSSSTFFNQDIAARVAPAVEYNFYPYSESTRRQLTVRYSIGPTFFDYEERTIYDRTEQTVLVHRLESGVVMRQPWGSVNVSAEGSQFLNARGRYRLQTGGGVELNVFRGLSLDLDGSYELIRDQIYLRAGDASDEEVLLRQRQLATGFQYFASVGLSYTFGSRFSTVVNPRFSGF